VADVERANYCEEFEFREIEDPEEKNSKSRRGNSRRESQPESLSAARGNSARERFENLFKK